MDASSIAREVGLVIAGVEMVNTAMLGALARVTGLAGLEDLRATFMERFAPGVAERNVAAARLAYERTQCCDRRGPPRRA